ncbi:MAG TPA: extracellular solute-binding protein [Candidatus Dormibacteraeota bacterium]|nr:extracellular solute-binding protein [Candidatus Dormibacteraeota bacterium]
MSHAFQFSRAIVVSALILLTWPLVSCHHAPSAPVSIAFVDPEWSHDTSERKEIMEAVLQEFTRQTGIQVRHLPAPESVADQLSLARQMLSNGTADVYGIDVVWPGILKDSLLDLGPDFASDMANEDPELVANFTVQKRLVAVPFHTNVGVLFYRSDLLHEYGFSAPPRAWDELEKMAARIQAGERAKGNRDFWGYVWPGGAGEGLTCDALEWQFSEGGGHIIEPDGTISVNNPNAVRAWQRAARWIGKISSPSVPTYQEWDAINAFRYTRKAAFLRSWTSDYFLSHPVRSEIANREGVTAVPRGSAARVSALGGLGLAISRSTTHQAEAVRLVKFLLQKEKQVDEERSKSHAPGQDEMVDLPAILKAYSTAPQSPEKRQSSVVARPSTVTGEKYERVSQAYFQAVHSVLSGKAKADAAAAGLEKELAGITGFQPGPLPAKQN